MGGLLATLMAGSMVALAEEVAEDLEMSDEAWFFRHRDPIEPVPPGGGVDELSDATEIPRATARDQTNPYRNDDNQPTETLHVGVNLGEEEAITFLGLPVTELGASVEVTGGEVRLPISGFGGAQERNPEGADMIACVATDLVVDAHGGSWDSMYEYDCGTRSDVVLEEGSDPLTWTIDLAPLAVAWTADAAVPPAFAIVPNPETELSPPEQTWHVSWQNRHYQPGDGDPEKRPITVTLSYIEEEFPEIGGGFDDPDTGDFGGGDFAAPAPGGTTGGGGQASFRPGAASGFSPPPAAPDPDIAPGEEPAAEAAPADEPAAAAPPMEPVDIRTHPALYLLPFIAVGLAGLLGYSLAQQPVLPHSREGAVSALMRKRRTAALEA